MAKSPDAFRTISEVADWLDVPTHVLRFWESRFTQVKPVKRAGGRRYYRPSDMELLGGIKRLLHDDGLTIRGVQKLLREEGVKHVASLSPSLDGRIKPSESNIVKLTPRSDDPDAALSRWPFVDDVADENSSSSEDSEDAESIETAPSLGTTEEDPEEAAAEKPTPPALDEPELRPAESARKHGTAVTEPDLSPKPNQNEPESSDTHTTHKRMPFPQPPVFDEASLYFAAPLPISGLARMTRRTIVIHSDLLERVLDRGRDLARSMDRVDG